MRMKVSFSILVVGLAVAVTIWFTVGDRILPQTETAQRIIEPNSTNQSLEQKPKSGSHTTPNIDAQKHRNENLIKEELADLRERCGPAFYSSMIGGDPNCVPSDSLKQIIGEWDIEQFNPPVATNCSDSIVEEVLDSGAYSVVSGCDYERPVDSYDSYGIETLKELALEQQDPLAALRLYQTVTPFDEAKIWLLHASALAEGKKVAGVFLREAGTYQPQIVGLDGRILPDQFIGRIALEELAASRGHPAANPEYWRDLLQQMTQSEEFDEYSRQIAEFKNSRESFITAQRTKYGLILEPMAIKRVTQPKQ